MPSSSSSWTIVEPNMVQDSPQVCTSLISSLLFAFLPFTLSRLRPLLSPISTHRRHPILLRKNHLTSVLLRPPSALKLHAPLPFFRRLSLLLKNQTSLRPFYNPTLHRSVPFFFLSFFFIALIAHLPMRHLPMRVVSRRQLRLHG